MGKVQTSPSESCSGAHDKLRRSPCCTHTYLLSHISSGRGSAGRLPRRVSQEVAVKLLAKDAVSSEGRTGQGGLFCF